MTTPTLIHLCERATKGPWSPPIWQKPGHPRNHSYVLCEQYMGAICDVHAKVPGTLPSQDDNPPLEEAVANGLLIARLNPEVARKVYEALEIAKHYLWVSPFEGALDAHAKIESALSALDGQPTPPDAPAKK